MKKWEKEILDKLKNDDSVLKTAIGSFACTKKTLEEICSKPVSTPSTDQLAALYAELDEASMIPSKYKGYPKSRLDEASPGLSGRLSMINQLDSMLYDAFRYSTKDLERRWKQSKGQFKRWKPVYGMDELKKERTSLNDIAGLYDHLSACFGGDLDNHSISELESYNHFLQDMAAVDAELTSLSKRCEIKAEDTAEKLNVQIRDLEDIQKKYNLAASRNRPIQDKIFSKNSIFLYMEGLYDADKLMDELLARKQAIESNTNTKLATTKAEIALQPIQQDSTSLAIPIPARVHYNTSSYCPIIRNQTNRFDLATYLLVLGYPPMKYMKLMDTMLGKTGIRHPIERLTSFGKQLEGLPPANSVSDMDYLYHLEHAIRKDMNHGSLDQYIVNNPQYWEKAHSALAGLGSYIKSSEESLGFDTSKIRAHLPDTGKENKYNLMSA